MEKIGIQRLISQLKTNFVFITLEWWLKFFLKLNFVSLPYRIFHFILRKMEIGIFFLFSVSVFSIFRKMKNPNIWDLRYMIFKSQIRMQLKISRLSFRYFHPDSNWKRFHSRLLLRLAKQKERKISWLVKREKLRPSRKSTSAVYKFWLMFIDIAVCRLNCHKKPL